MTEENDESNEKKPRKRENERDEHSFDDIGKVINNAIRDVFEQFGLDQDSFMKDLFNPDNRTRRGRGFPNAWGFALKRDPRGKIKFHQFGNPPFQIKKCAHIPEGVRPTYYDVIDNEKDYRIIVELPGIKKEDIDLQIAEQEISVKSISDNKHRQFAAKISLNSSVIAKSAQAKFNNGVLEITIPKKAFDEGFEKIIID